MKKLLNYRDISFTCPKCNSASSSIVWELVQEYEYSCPKCGYPFSEREIRQAITKQRIAILEMLNFYEAKEVK